VEKSIDEGSFADILLASNESGTKVVIKRMSKLRARRELALKEVKAGRLLRFIEGIPTFHEFYEDEQYFYLVFDFVNGVNLFSMLEDRNMKPMAEHDAQGLFRQLIKTVQHAHSRGVFHLDLKLENLMLDNKGSPKVIDWGLCSFAHNLSDDTVDGSSGSVEYCSPEVLRRGAYSGRSADVFSLGVVLYILLFAEFPWSRKDKLKAAVTGENLPLSFPPLTKVFVSGQAKDLLSKMLTDQSNRISLHEVVQHKWMNPMPARPVNSC
jgi:serine/threonine protein kinase